MLNYRSKPSKDEIFIKIAIWGANLVLCSAPEFGPHPGVAMGVKGVYPSMWELRVCSGPK